MPWQNGTPANALLPQHRHADDERGKRSREKKSLIEKRDNGRMHVLEYMVSSKHETKEEKKGRRVEKETTPCARTLKNTVHTFTSFATCVANDDPTHQHLALCTAIANVIFAQGQIRYRLLVLCLPMRLKKSITFLELPELPLLLLPWSSYASAKRRLF